MCTEERAVELSFKWRKRDAWGWAHLSNPKVWNPTSLIQTAYMNDPFEKHHLFLSGRFLVVGHLLFLACEKSEAIVDSSPPPPHLRVPTCGSVAHWVWHIFSLPSFFGCC